MVDIIKMQFEGVLKIPSALTVTSTKPFYWSIDSIEFLNELNIKKSSIRLSGNEKHAIFLNIEITITEIDGIK